MLKISAGTGESFQFAGLFPTLESNDLIHLVITSQLPTFAFSGFGPQPPWKNDYLNRLEDPLLIDGASRCYRFGVKGVSEFEREHVINDYADVRHNFPSGHSVKGFLLAYGFDPIPEQFRQGTMAPGFAIVYDQFGASIALLWSCRWCGTEPHRVSCGSATCSDIAIQFRAVRGRSSCGSQSAGGFVINVMATTRAAP